MLKKKLLFLIGIMLVLSIAGAGIASAAKKDGQLDGEQQKSVLTSFYPIYILAKNLTAGTETTVSNLTQNQTGCLHDYQLTTRDMKLLSTADIFVINGSQMELFLADVLKNYPELPIIDTTQGMELLEGVAHDHNHDHEEEHEEEEEHAEENGHVWMNVERYRQQAKNLYEGLAAEDELHKVAYQAAYEAYDEKLAQLQEQVNALSEKTNGIPVVLFHEAFAYLADSLSMEVLQSIALDEDVVPSAGEIAEVIEEIKYHGRTLILIEEAYAAHAEKIVAETNAVVVYLDSLTTGEEEADSYLIKMQENLLAIEAAIAAWEQ